MKAPGSACPRCTSRVVRDDGAPLCLACGWRPVERARVPADHRRYARGERNGNAKLTDAQVAAIRERAAAGWTYARLGAAFGVSGRQVGNIVRREHWE